MPALYDERSPKKAVNLSVNSDLLQQTKKMDINLSATFENALVELIRKKQKEHWKEENLTAIKLYNKHIKNHGVFSKGSRCF